MDRSFGDGGMALLGQLGVSFDAYGEGWATAAWVPTELACNPAGAVHGGVYGVVHDAAMNFATNAALESEVVRLARQVAYLETAIRDADGRYVSKGTGTFLVRRKEHES